VFYDGLTIYRSPKSVLCYILILVIDVRISNSEAIWVNFVVALLCGLVYIRAWGDFRMMIFTDPVEKYLKVNTLKYHIKTLRSYCFETLLHYLVFQSFDFQRT
jgi:hypothetical protein